MKNVQLIILLSVHCFCGGVCVAQQRPDSPVTSAFIAGIGGLGGNFQRTPLNVTGGTWAAGTHTSAYSIGYRQQLSRRLSGSVTYINQGHYDRHSFQTRHHSRDDIQVELAMSKRPRSGPMEFRLGGGGGYYSETDQTGDGDDEFENHQGFGFVLGGALDVDISRRLFVEARVDRHLVLNRYDSTSALFGMGVRLQTRDHWNPLEIAPAAEGATSAAKPSKHSIRINVGLGRLNSKQSETLRHAFQLTYELAVSRRFALATSYVREGTAPELNRKGIAFQGAVKQELTGALTLGLGLGPYINADHSDFFHRRGRLSVDALFTAFLDVRVTRRFEVGVSTSRPRSLTTLQNKPMTDVFQTGVKVRL
jgi:hypothetical protein